MAKGGGGEAYRAPVDGSPGGRKMFATSVNLDAGENSNLALCVVHTLLYEHAMLFCMQLRTHQVSVFQPSGWH